MKSQWKRIRREKKRCGDIKSFFLINSWVFKFTIQKKRKMRTMKLPSFWKFLFFFIFFFFVIEKGNPDAVYKKRVNDRLFLNLHKKAAFIIHQKLRKLYLCRKLLTPVLCCLLQRWLIIFSIHTEVRSNISQVSELFTLGFLRCSWRES